MWERRREGGEEKDSYNNIERGNFVSFSHGSLVSALSYTTQDDTPRGAIGFSIGYHRRVFSEGCVALYIRVCCVLSRGCCTYHVSSSAKLPGGAFENLTST